MMNVPPRDAYAMSLWEYEARLHHWNAAHSTGDDIQPPDFEKTQRMLDKVNLDPRLYEGKKPN
jgi:hypothetical protein